MPPPLVARAVLLACLAALAVPARAQAPDTLRLDAVLDAVYADNPTLAAARLDARALARRGDQVGALPDPTASVMVAPYPILTARGHAAEPVARRADGSPWPGTLGLRRDAVDAAAEAARLGADATALDLARDATRAYADLVRTQEAADVVRAFQARLGAFAEAAAVRYEVGRGPQGAILQVQLERQRLDERLIELGRQRDAAVQTLARVLDRPGLTVGRVVTPPAALPDADDLDALAFDLRPEVAAAQARIDQAEIDVALAERAFYPDLGVGVVYTDIAPADAPPTATGRDALGLMASVRIPLGRDRLRAGVEEARLRQRAAEVRLEATRTAVQTALADALSDARRAAEAVALYRDTLLPLSLTTVESALAGYTTGAVDFLAFLDAERARFQIQLGLVDARAHLLDASADLARAVGLTTPDALSGPSR